MKAVLDKVIVRLQKEESSFFLGSFEKEPDTGVVISVGDYANGGCKEGDLVVFDKRGNDFAFEKDGDEYLVIQERRVYFILKEGSVETTYDKVVISTSSEESIPSGTVIATGNEVRSVSKGQTVSVNGSDLFTKEIDGETYHAVTEKKVICTDDDDSANT